MASDHEECICTKYPKFKNILLTKAPPLSASQ
jgi:hypothetical protein